MQYDLSLKIVALQKALMTGSEIEDGNFFFDPNRKLVRSRQQASVK